jgi:hypothetical protein
VPGFYRVLQEQDQQKQIEKTQELRESLEQLLEVAHPKGPFFMGPQMSLVDVQAAPWIIRLRRILKPYRGWPDPEEGSRLAAWVNAIETDQHVQATTSTDELYLDSYERYAREYLAFSFANDVDQFVSQKTVQTHHKSQMRSTQDKAFLDSREYMRILRLSRWPLFWREEMLVTCTLASSSTTIEIEATSST